MSAIIQQLVDRYQLSPHPEGGHFREIYRSTLTVVSPVGEAVRNAATHIYFLLGKDERSRFHRVVHDEIWNYYTGAPLRLIRYVEGTAEEVELGGEGGDFVSVVPGGVWQAAESTGDYSLVGCTVAPGFDFADFRFLAPDKDGSVLAALPDTLRRFI